MALSADNMTDYLKTFGNELAGKVASLAQPLFRPGDPWDPRLHQLLRKPLQAQGDVIMGIAAVLQERNSAMVIGEMGTGKTIIGIGITALHPDPALSLVICPSHLVKKWRREILKTIPGAKAIILRSFTDLLNLDYRGRPKAHEYHIISKEKAKLGYSWKAAVVRRRSQNAWGLSCPSCGKLIVDDYGQPIERDKLNRVKTTCQGCGQPLWCADHKGIRRFPLAQYIKTYLGDRYDYLIADEAHQYKGGASAQGNAFGMLAAACKKTISLTGTLIGGYADDLFYLIGRTSIQSFLAKGIGYKDLIRFTERYGLLEKVTRVKDEEDNSNSRGKKRSTRLKRLPGTSPRVFSDFLLGSAAFLRLSDVSDELPEFHEEVVPVAMDDQLSVAYKYLEGELKRAVDQSLRAGSTKLLGTWLNTTLAYPDRPYENNPIMDPEVPGRVIVVPPELPQDRHYPKEDDFLARVRAETAAGNKVFLFCVFTDTKDVTGRIKSLIDAEGIPAAVLSTKVAPEKREDWLAAQVASGIQVVIGNPRLVETGLDLFDFTTLIFLQTGYSTYTLRQASRRSYRIGQTKPVNVYYYCYVDTMEDKALSLMGGKMEAALALEGQFSDEGLVALTSGSNITTALAKALAGTLQVEGAGEVWARLNSKASGKNMQRPAAELAPPATVEPSKVIHADFLVSKGRRKTVRVDVPADQLESFIADNAEGKSVQLALFG